MPDNDLTAETETTPEQSDLDRLVNEAEQQANDDPESKTLPQNTVTKCDHAGSDLHSRRWCRNCKQLICQFCWSVLDSNYCTGCMQTVDLTVKEATLVDDEGVTHQGRLITPSTGFNQLRWSPSGTTSKLLCEMSKPELIDFIEAYRTAVRDAERALDFRRIRLSSAQLELDERRDAERRALRADKKKYPIKTVTVDVKTGTQVKKTASSTAMLDMLRALEALQQLKAKKAATKPEVSNGE